VRLVVYGSRSPVAKPIFLAHREIFSKSQTCFSPFEKISILFSLSCRSRKRNVSVTNKITIDFAKWPAGRIARTLTPISGSSMPTLISSSCKKNSPKLAKSQT